MKEYLLPADSAFPHLRYINVTEKQAVRFSNGGELDASRTALKPKTDGELVRVKFGDVLLGLGRVDLESGSIKISCVINDKDGSDSREQ